MSETFRNEIPDQMSIQEKSGRMLLDQKSGIVKFLDGYKKDSGNALSREERKTISDFFQGIIDVIKDHCHIKTIDEMNQAKALCWLQGINHVIRSFPIDRDYIRNEMERVWVKVEVDSNKSLQSSSDQVSLMKMEQAKILQNRASDLRQVFQSLRNSPNDTQANDRAISALEEIKDVALSAIGKFAINPENHAFAVMALNGFINNLKKGPASIFEIDVIETLVNNSVRIIEATDRAVVYPSGANTNHVLETLEDTKKDMSNVIQKHGPTSVN